MTTNVYVLQLEQGKYYVGRTNNVEERIREHMSGIGSEWTTLYKPVAIIEIIENCNADMEDIVTKKYMGVYGRDNVRGGSYCRVNLPNLKLPARKKNLQEKRNNNDQCFRCGSRKHFVADCKSKVQRCFLCNTKGHYASNCGFK